MKLRTKAPLLSGISSNHPGYRPNRQGMIKEELLKSLSIYMFYVYKAYPAIVLFIYKYIDKNKEFLFNNLPKVLNKLRTPSPALPRRRKEFPPRLRRWGRG
jgi:hypothetical protein